MGDAYRREDVTIQWVAIISELFFGLGAILAGKSEL
jgi:hypothetical protein